MPVIHMQTEQVRATADMMRAVAVRMGNLHEFLNMQIRQLPSVWQGGDAADFHGEVQFLARQLDQHIRALDVLASRVHAEVTEWETVDGPTSTAASLSIRQGENVDRASGFRWNQLNDQIEIVLMAIGGFLTASHVSWRKDELIFQGKNYFREWAGLPGHLRHVKATNLPNSFIKSAFKISAVDKALLGLDLAGRYFHSWAHYNRVGDRVAVATMDAIFVGARFAVVRAGQAAAMSLMGGALGALAAAGAPAAVVIGAGVLVWWGSGQLINMVANRAYDLFEGSGWKDKIVQNTGNLIESGAQAAGQAITSGIQAGASFFQWNRAMNHKAAQMVDSGFRRVIGRIASAFD